MFGVPSCSYRWLMVLLKSDSACQQQKVLSLLLCSVKQTNALTQALWSAVFSVLRLPASTAEHQLVNCTAMPVLTELVAAAAATS